MSKNKTPEQAGEPAPPEQAGEQDEFEAFEQAGTEVEVDDDKPGRRCPGRPKKQAPIAQVAAALKAIPNTGEGFAKDKWDQVAAAVFAATEGSTKGYELFDDWSVWFPECDEKATRARWQELHDAPPDRSAANTLFSLADEADPDWRNYYDSVEPAQAKAGKPPAFDGEPVDLWGNFEPPTLPRGLLPELIETYAFTQAETMGVDPGGVAMAALTVCAAAIPDSIQLMIKLHTREWKESARIWVGLVGPPSVKKSPIISATVRPLARLDAELFRKFLAESQIYEEMEKEERKETARPVQRRLQLEDTTIEGAQEVLANSPNGVLMVQDELSGFFGSMDKYSGQRGAAKDRAFWLQAYNGKPYSVNRIGRGAKIIANLSICLLGGIQPDVIRRLSAESYDDGALQRMLLIMLRQANAGKDVPTPEVSEDYAILIEELTKLQLPVSGNLNNANDGVLRFDSNAQELRDKLEAEHLGLMKFEAINGKLAAHIGKYEGLFGRLCVTFHCIKHAYSPHLPATVIEDTATRVAGFMRRFLLPHALAFYSGVLNLADEHDRLAAVAGYILAHQKQRMTNRDVQRGDRSMRKLTRRETEAIFEQLDALGWVARVPGSRPSDPPHWVVNPAVHRKFAERGREEAERRAQERAVLQGIAVS